MHLHLWAFALQLQWLTVAATTGGSSLCPCLDELPGGMPRVSDNDSRLIYEELGGRQYYLPEDYGIGCMAHDWELEPHCSAPDDAPTWCFDLWCYVDARTCDERYQSSAYFPAVSGLAFSYQTCGPTHSDFGDATEEGFVGRLLDEAQRYMRSSRNFMEEALRDGGLESIASCPLSSSFCEACSDCISLQLWGGVGVLYEDVGFWLNQVQLVGEAAALQTAATCMSSMIRGAYSKVAAAEGSPDRVGFQYFTDQFTGSYTQMPHTDWCPTTSYDPRLRPWYASGATGPKDVIIVVDTSGSMASGLSSSSMTRSDAAYAATLALLDTLSWADHFDIVLFSDAARASFTRTWPANEYNKQSAREFMARENWAGGSTNFQDGFSLAFESLKTGRDSGSTSTCNRIILFLSDGAPNAWIESDYTWLDNEARDLGAVIFTYGLSSNADATISKRIACENRGIYYQIDDSVAEQGLAAAMTSYYSYFAAGQTKCEASYLQYTDVISGKTLYGTCLPMKYVPEGSAPQVAGVTCMDLDLLTDMEEALKYDSEETRLNADNLICHMSAQTKKCLPLDLNDCQLERLRATTDYAERCDETTSIESCGCVDGGCVDNPTFVDELGYYCDAWVGDNCERGVFDFTGYTSFGMFAVNANCPRSCGTCPYLSDDTTCGEDHCAVPELPTTCRACNGISPGLDMWGRPMQCPGDSGGSFTTVSSGGESTTIVDDGESSEAGPPIIVIVVVAVFVVFAFAFGGIMWVTCAAARRGSRWEAGSRAGSQPPIVVATPVTNGVIQGQVVGATV